MRIIIKSAILHALAVVGYLFALPLWFKSLGKGREIRILRYHSVNEFGKNEVAVRESEFESQLDFLLRHYSVISLEEAVGFLKEGKLPSRPSVAITFDDGYEDNYQVAYPILKRKSIPATIFLLTGGESTDRRLPHLGEEESEYNRLLSWDEVREMRASGTDFGSHGETHTRLRNLSQARLSDEIFSSKEKIQSQIGTLVRFFSYPYGTPIDFDERAQSSVEQADYEAALSATFGTNGLRSNRFALRRIGIEASDSLFTLRAKLNGALGLLSIFDWPPFRKTIRGFDSIFLKRKPTVQEKSLILLVSVDFPPHTDGVSTISKELSHRIAKRGEKVFVIGPKDRGDRELDALQPYRVFRLPGYDWGYLRFIPILISMPWVVLRHRIRKVFAMNIAYGGILSWLLSFVLPLEYVIFAYGYEFEKVKQNAFARWLYQRIYRRAKSTICCSREVRQRLILFGAPAEKIEVLYPAVDLNRYRPCEVPRTYLEEKRLLDRKIILTVGRLIERKGHDQVLKALPKIVQFFPSVLYCIVGIGPYEAKLRTQVQSLNLENHVRFMGKVSEDDLHLLYNASEVFVMPSREISEGGHVEGFGIVYLEASACGKPVIGGNSGGVSEAIQDGETGFLVNPSSPDEIAAKVIDLLSHPEKAQRLGRQGLEWVRQDFDWERYSQKAYSLLCGGDLP
jgi:phosphatidylinositol alpha-1,6-mannosyltransferase